MPNSPLWIAVFLLGCLLAGAVLGAWLAQRRQRPRRLALPTNWTVSSRPVFTREERRAHRHLREALPHHVVLAKLPLVRLCRPEDPREARYWFTLLSALHVTFAVCSPSGRVLAAVDLIDDEHPVSARRLRIKQTVLAACRVQYLRCTPEQLPTTAELQLLVPQPGVLPRGPQPAPLPRGQADPALQPHALWQDSSVLQDSFFGTDRRDSTGFGALNDSGGSTHAGLFVREFPARATAAQPPSAWVTAPGGVVVDDDAPPAPLPVRP